MKLLYILVVLCGACVAQAQTTKTFTIAFDYAEADLADTNITFRAHSSQTIVAPVESWATQPITWLRESTNAGLVTLVSSNRVTATSPKTFFVVSASNEWGLVFSEVLGTGPAPRAGKPRLR